MCQLTETGPHKIHSKIDVQPLKAKVITSQANKHNMELHQQIIPKKDWTPQNLSDGTIVSLTFSNATTAGVNMTRTANVFTSWYQFIKLRFKSTATRYITFVESQQ